MKRLFKTLVLFLCIEIFFSIIIELIIDIRYSNIAHASSYGTIVINQPNLGRDINVINNIYSIRENYFFKDKEDKFLRDLEQSGVQYENPLSHYKKAVERIQQGDLNAAIKSYSDVLTIASFPEAYVGRGRAYLEIGKKSITHSDEAKQLFLYAIEDYTKALGLKPLCAKVESFNCDSKKYVEPLLARSAAYQIIGNYEESLKDLNSAIERSPDLYDAYLARANVYLNRSVKKNNREKENTKIENAIHDLNIALKLNPDFPSALLLFGEIELQQEKYLTAIEYFTKVIKSQEEDAEKYFAQAYTERGFSYLKQNNNQLAVDDYIQAISFNSDYSEAYLGLGKAQFAIQDYQKAIENLTQGLQSGSNYDEVYYLRGISYLKMKKYREAESDFNLMIRRNYHKSEVYYNRGLTYLNLSKYQAAISDFNQAIEENSDNVVDAYLGRGKARFFFKDDKTDAIQDFARVISLQPKSAEAYQWRGNCYYTLGNYTYAIQDYNQAISLKSDYVEAYLWRGKAHYNLKEYTSGIDDFKNALNLQSTEASGYEANIQNFIQSEIFPLAYIKSHSEDTEAVFAIAISPDGKILASGGKDKTIKLFNLNKQLNLILTLTGHSEQVLDVTFTPDGNFLASSSSDNNIKVWNINTGKEIRTLSGHTRWVRSIDISADRKILASGSDDKTIKLWDINTGQEIRTLSGHSNYVNSVAISPDGKYLASGSRDRTIKLWDLNTGQELRTFSGHSDWVRAVTFSSDGKLIASGSDDKTIKLWNVSSGKLIHELQGHSGCVTAVAFSPDGQLLASGSDDYTVKLWDTNSGTKIATLPGHSNYVQAVTFSSDGHTLASGAYDNTLRVWRVP